MITISVDINSSAKIIGEDILSRLELEHLSLNKTMSPIKVWESDYLVIDT
jgi:hypothetical protein